MALRGEAVVVERRAGEGAGDAASISLQRSVGAARIAFKRRGTHTVLGDVYQGGCCKVRFPRAEPDSDPEAVLINTAGGLTDGDVIETSALWGEGTRAVVTTQAAERIYRSRGADAYIANHLVVETAATALWLPQETILFDGGRLNRRLEATIAEDGRLIACEATIFGRHAMGETIRTGAIQDIWRVRHGGKLVFADGFHLSGDMEQILGRPGIADGAAAIATVIHVGHADDMLLDELRAVSDGLPVKAACSQLGSVIVGRLLAPSGATLRFGLIGLLNVLLNRAEPDEELRQRDCALPRVWNC